MQLRFVGHCSVPGGAAPLTVAVLGMSHGAAVRDTALGRNYCRQKAVNGRGTSEATESITRHTFTSLSIALHLQQHNVSATGPAKD